MPWSAITKASDQNIAMAPASHGIYALYSAGPLIYIGRAWGTGVTIRSRLQAHKRGDEGVCTQAMTDFAYLVTADSQKAESEALAHFRHSVASTPKQLPGAAQ